MGKKKNYIESDNPCKSTFYWSAIFYCRQGYPCIWPSCFDRLLWQLPNLCTSFRLTVVSWLPPTIRPYPPPTFLLHLQTRSLEFLFAFLFLLVGVLLYFPFVHFRYKLHFLDRITVFIQRLMVVTKSKLNKWFAIQWNPTLWVPPFRGCSI